MDERADSSGIRETFWCHIDNGKHSYPHLGISHNCTVCTLVVFFSLFCFRFVLLLLVLLFLLLFLFFWLTVTVRDLTQQFASDYNRNQFLLSQVAVSG